MIRLNGKEVKFETFPNGETRLIHSIVLENLNNKNCISFKYENDSDLIKLMFLKNYIDNLNNFHNELLITYMPYSRMDRSEQSSPFTLKYVARFINNLNFNYVTVIEPHSDVTAALLNRVHSEYINFHLIDKVKEEIGFNEDEDYVMFPDQGAAKRYSKMKSKNVLIGNKVRDFQTGEIKGLDLIGNTENIKENKVLIVDDLSSYGGTFVKSAEKLRDKGFKEVYLLVAHAENSVFKGKLFDHIDKLFTTDSILTEQNNSENEKFNNKLKIYKIEGVVSNG